MNIGLFTDTYYPQVSGVATSISVLRDTLEEMGHQVYIFTSTDPKVAKNVYERNIFRFPSVPFTGFPDRRIAYSGGLHAVQIAKELELDIVHTQTEFSMGLMGKFVAFNLKIPAIHTYHTMYQDYLHYVANGKLIGPRTVKTAARNYLKNMEGVVAPSKLVLDTMLEYGVTAPIKIIPTGVNIKERVSQSIANKLRTQLGLALDTPVVLSLGRLAFEKNIEDTIDAFKTVLAETNDAMLIIAGDGPAKSALENHAQAIGIEKQIKFVGMIEHQDVIKYYAMADVFVSSSDSESQGLTYLEAISQHTPIVVMDSPYVKELITDPSIGTAVNDVAQLSANILKYLQTNEPLGDENVLEAKIRAVSAENFGEKIVEFYEEVIESYRIDTQKNNESFFNAFSNPFRH